MLYQLFLYIHVSFALIRSLGFLPTTPPKINSPFLGMYTDSCSALGFGFFINSNFSQFWSEKDHKSFVLPELPKPPNRSISLFSVSYESELWILFSFFTQLTCHCSLPLCGEGYTSSCLKNKDLNRVLSMFVCPA